MDATVDWALTTHPQAQFRRSDWTDLRGHWGFAFDDDDRGIEDNWSRRADVFGRKILVPFPPESSASGIHEHGYHPVVWYRHVFDIPVAGRAPGLHLTFGAVDYEAQVWVNGQLVGRHEGGHTPFTFDIAAWLSDGTEQTIVVRVRDDPLDLTQPRGKQYWELEPAKIWYHRTTGIWQPVWLERVGEAYVETVRWTTYPERFAVQMRLRVGGRVAKATRVRLRLSLGGDMLVDDHYGLNGAVLDRAIVLPQRMHRVDAVCWTPHHPHLIDASIELLGADGGVLDVIDSYFGLRRIEAVDGKLLLNGVPLFLRLVLAQNYWPQSHLAPPSDEAIRREVEFVKELGFNGVRIHQKIEDPRFLYWCDRLGVLVWGEAANAFQFDERAAERLCREWAEAVQRDYNHPCIITWVPLNESWGVPDLEHEPAQRAYVKALYFITKTLDPTRPVIGNDGWQNAVGDIFGVHDYAKDPVTLTERYGSNEALRRTFEAIRPAHDRLLVDGQTFEQQPVVVSEFGGLSIRPTEGENWHGYATTENAQDLLALYGALVGALLDSTGIAGFCYTQLTDTEQETNGLLTAARKPKLDVASVCKITSRPAKSVPSELLAAIFEHEVSERRRSRVEE
ncbi:MAG: glycoside hydrolase family 2 [Pseudomonadota bacterium]|nr:glycoside hydrolase family 2 [Pseudomonadota bacterium]